MKIEVCITTEDGQCYVDLCTDPDGDAHVRKEITSAEYDQLQEAGATEV